jgi:D-apionate oxidoisomerase
VTTVAIIGAAGVQGAQISRRLIDGGAYEVLCVEAGAGVERLRSRGVTPLALEDAGRRADAVVIAVPDELIATVAAEVVPVLASGVLAIVLDAAAPFAQPLVERDDIGFAVLHPCHPSVFTTQLTAAGERDYAGGVTGQDVMCCLAHGEERHYATAEQLARAMFAPVDAVHRITLEQFILLEPTMSETTAAMLLTAIREAMDEAIARGVPETAARAFMYGHIGIELAIIFGELDAAFSKSAYLAIDRGRELILRPDWKQVFEPGHVRAIAEEIAVSEPRVT